MTKEISRDAVTAISEAEATGEIAEIFADIRATMQLPLITSIWRTIVDVVGGLQAAWPPTKLLYETGQPEAALHRILGRVTLPIPQPIVSGQLECAGVNAEDLPRIQAIVDAYNRSNGMNLLALTGLVVPKSGTPVDEPRPAPHSAWPALPRLREKSEIDEVTWTLLQNVNRIGMTGHGGSGIATLWRHLAAWPGLLAVIHSAFAPLHQDGTIEKSLDHLHGISQTEGARIAHLRSKDIGLPDGARQKIVGYVSRPQVVARMVTVGHGLAKWLQTGDPND